MSPQVPLSVGEALLAVSRCVAVSMWLLARRRLHLPRANVGRILRFRDDSTARVYRETVKQTVPREPCVLLVEFRLRGVRRRWGHALFRLESLLNTPLFVGFPGFVSKLWIARDERGTYRGLYEWDGPESAERYARALWRILAFVSQEGSIAYTVVPGTTRDAALAQRDRRHTPS